MLDLFRPHFWLAVLGAVLVLTPLVGLSSRRLAFAALNLGLLALLLKNSVVFAILFVVLIYLALRLGSGRPRAPSVFGSILLFSLSLLVVHKLPGLHYGPWSTASKVLGVLGFSYVFLRVVEVSRSVLSGQHPLPSPLALFNYLLPFHMLAAGPIQAYDAFAKEETRPLSGPAEVLSGSERIATGLFKKFVLAYSIERLFLTGFMVDGPYFLLEMHLYFLWFYLDFSAYSDIAVGVGRLMGIPTPENFNRPYLARNMIDFWQRWHITLGDWVLRNLFIPTQLWGMRRFGSAPPLAIASLSLTLAFMLCGLWHELSLRFFLWGAVHGIGVMAANAYREVLKKKIGRKGVKTYLERPWVRRIAIFITLEYVCFSMLIVGMQWEIL